MSSHPPAAWITSGKLGCQEQGRLTDIFFFFRGCEPLTGEDIAEVIVFAAGRRENVVIADTLVFPSHQVCLGNFSEPHTHTSGLIIGSGWCRHHAPQVLSLLYYNLDIGEYEIDSIF